MRDATTPRWLVAGTSALAVLVAIAALGGIYEPSVYAKETASWAAQGLGQDVVNLLVVVPLLLGCAFGIARGSRSALLVLAGALIYTLYSFVLYAFAMHFNVLFLVYCAVIGTSFYALVDIASFLRGQNAQTWIPISRHRRAIGLVLVGISLAFAGLWLSTVLPALIAGTAPRELEEVGLITNPVHILDLAIVLPGLAVTGALVLLGRPAGYLLATVALAFDALMTLAILGMNVAMWRSGLAIAMPVVIAMSAVEIVSLALLGSLLRQLAVERPMLSWLDQPHRL